MPSRIQQVNSTPSRTRLIGREKFLSAVEQAGITDWTIKNRKVVTDGVSSQRVTLSRDGEVFTFIWAGTTLLEGIYSDVGGGTNEWKNLSAAIRRMLEPPLTLHCTGRMVRLPFSLTDLDEEVLAAIAGRNITWINPLSEVEELATVPRESKHTRLDHADDPGKRTLTFCSESGFRSVRLEALVEVK